MPFDASLLTIVTGGILLAGTVLIVVLTWRNSQATGSVGQLLARTEKAPYHGEIDPRRFSDRDRD
jgi:hypothetical protein